MKKIDAETRRYLKNLFAHFFQMIDKSEENTKYYISLIDSMNDSQLTSYIDRVLKDPDEFFTLNVLPFHNEPSIDELLEAAKFLNSHRGDLGVLEQRVAYPHMIHDTEITMDNTDNSSKDTVKLLTNRVLMNHAPTTKFEVPTGYLHIKRLSQIVSKKTSYSTKDTTVRNALTNQITSDSKIARNTDAESFALITLNANNILKELLGARADNRTKNATMLNIISRHGKVLQSELDAVGDPRDNVTRNLTDVFFTGAGLKTDLVTDGLLLLNTYIQAGQKSLETLKKNFDANGNLIKENFDENLQLLAEYDIYLNTKFLQDLVVQLKEDSDKETVEYVKEMQEYHYLTLNSLCESYPEVKEFDVMRSKVASFIEVVYDNF